MDMLEKNIGYNFKSKNHLQIALTHSSYANEHRCKSYERYEFLGDSVLSIIVSEYLFDNMKDNNEGVLSRIRASLVCEESLAEIARELDFGKYILLGKGEEKAGSCDRSSILSDTYESVLAAIYLDGGMNEAKKYVLNTMNKKLNDAVCGNAKKDNKTMLQEFIQKESHGKNNIRYNVVEETGPEHLKYFVVDLLINGKKVSTGEGHSKKEAEQKAAKKALQIFKTDF